MAKSLEYWRGYFSGACSDICGVIENALIVAALDHPEAFKLKRDHLAELLFTCQLTKCSGCEGAELSVPKNGAGGETLLEGEKLKSGGEVQEEGEKKAKEEGEKKVDGCDDVHALTVIDEDAEELHDKLEKESQLMEEALRIKTILDNHEESESVLLDSLRKLQLMNISIEVLKVTEIGMSVKRHKKHGSQQIKDLVQTLIKGWIDMLDSYYVNAPTATKEDTPESIKTSNVDFEDGLPSPPLEEGAFINHSIELNEFFDGMDMDNDGNPINNGDVKNSRGSDRKPPLKSVNVPKHKQQQLPNALPAPPLKNKVQQSMKEEAIKKQKVAAVNPNKPSSGYTVLIKTRAEEKVIKKSQPERDERALLKKPFVHPDDVNLKYRDQQSANGATRTKLLPPQKEKLRSSDEAAIQVKTLATKRKLQERYQEPETAKKQRTNQMTPLRDITKQGTGQNHKMRPGHSNHNRH